VPATGRQIGLRACGANAAQGVAHREAQMPCQFRRLIEPAGAPAASMKRHRHNHDLTLQQIASMTPQHRCERACQRTATAILQRMQDLSERAGVFPDGPPG
jgi:hypothetical protein